MNCFGCGALIVRAPRCVYCARPLTRSQLEELKRQPPDPRDDPKRNIELRKGMK